MVVYRGSSRRQAARLKESGTFRKKQKRNRRPEMSAGIALTLESMKNKRAFRRTHKSVTVVQPLWTVCLDEIVSCFGGKQREEEVNENV